jgi:prenyl protein peptidase
VVIYVLPFYLSAATRPSPTLTRDAPSSIRARTRAVTFSTTVCTAITALYLYQHGVTAYQLLHLFGIWPITVFDIARGMLLVCILFAGPLYEAGIVDGDWKDWIKLRGLHETLSSWIGYRNFVVVRIAQPTRSHANPKYRALSVRRLYGALLWFHCTSLHSSPKSRLSS